jgi:hypothetical protein
MYMDISWKAALFTIIGIFVLATVVMNSSAVARSSTESKAVNRSAPANSICNILYPAPCSDVQPW